MYSLKECFGDSEVSIIVITANFMDIDVIE